MSHSLSILQFEEKILATVNENPVVVIIGETGSGKSTQLSQILLRNGYTNSGIIAVSLPFPSLDELLQVIRENQVIVVVGETGSGKTTQLTTQVSEEMETELGDKVGYAIRFEDVTGPKTVIKYMTDGVLLRETLKDADLDKYRVVVMDEAHDRSLSTDVMFGILIKVVARRRDFKLIVTSATLNAQKFSNFFGRRHGIDVAKSLTAQVFMSWANFASPLKSTSLCRLLNTKILPSFELASSQKPKLYEQDWKLEPFLKS
ncbi:pre-mRNA-splicing factor ATP-dependent RNA helicase DEAH7 [Tanacetum coccineum]